MFEAIAYDRFHIDAIAYVRFDVDYNDVIVTMNIKQFNLGLLG